MPPDRTSIDRSHINEPGDNLVHFRICKGCEIVEPLNEFSTLNELAQCTRIPQRIEGLSWYLGRGQCFVHFHEVAMPVEVFSSITADILPVHTHVDSCQIYGRVVHVKWRPTWISARDVDSCFFEGSLDRVEARLKVIPVPKVDFSWRSETHEAVSDFSRSFQLFLMDACDICRITSA